MKVEIFLIVKTYSNGKTKIESGPFYSLMDALAVREKFLFPFEKDYTIAKVELDMEMVC